MSGILAVLEHSNGTWHRMSLEALAAAQELGQALGIPVGAAVLGGGAGSLASELARKKVEQVYTVEHELLAAYTADGHT
ncbi:MAG: electron transfer flavoprotein subunit alpha/FixB family protein, partial [Bryobacteraceae bacterium]